MQDATTDRIVANADRFDTASMDEYQRIAQYAEAHVCSFEKALAACNVPPLDPDRFDTASMDEYQRIAQYAEEHGCSFEKAISACPHGLDPVANAQQWPDDVVRDCHEVICLNRVAIPVDAPDRFQIMPWGRFKSNVPDRSPVDTLVDEQSFDLILAAFNAGGDILVDYEHQSEGQARRSDGLSPAAGWIKALDAVPGEGIYATIEWTARAAELLTNREYRYPSFAGLVRKSDGRVLKVYSVALTNKPFITDMKAIVNSAGGRCRSRIGSASEMALSGGF